MRALRLATSQDARYYPGMTPADVALDLPRPEPLDLASTARFLRLGERDPSWHIADRCVARATHTPDGPVTIRIEDCGGKLAVSAWGSGSKHAAAIACGLTGADDDPDSFAPEHAGLRRLAAKWRGLRLPRVYSALDALTPTIFQQLIPFEEAAATWRRALVGLNRAAPGPLGLLLPPSATDLRQEPGWRWEQAGLSRRRAETLARVGVHAKRLEEAFDDPVFARARWSAIPGIGPWTVEHALAVRCGEADALILGDATLPSTVSFALRGEREACDADLAELLAPFAPHRYRVVRLLWAEGVKPPRRAPKPSFRDPGL